MRNKRIWAWLVISVLGVAVFCLSLKYSPNKDIVGSDRDEHGCIGSAGYSWCDEKNKCLRQWEEACKDDANGIVCTQDAKLCPDGSYVGRTGPKCEFANCPSMNGILPYNSGINGVVTLGPTCPVERTPPDPGCADRPYKTLISIFRQSDQASALLYTSSDDSGKFSISLSPGEYILKAGDDNFVLPNCNPIDLTVEPDLYTSVTVSCDTGIR